MGRLVRLVNWWLDREEINGGGVCPTYMVRWCLLGTPWCKVYVHRFVGDDWARDPHDHPKRFFSIGLWGSYIEERYSVTGEKVADVRWRAPWVRSFAASHIHRIRATETGGAVTLVIVGRVQRRWGFWLRGAWVPWDRYVPVFGRSRKDC